MDVRTTNLGTSTSMTNYIRSIESKYYQLAQQASSGLKVTSPSDDPAAAKAILGVNVQINQINGYLDNMSTAQNELDVLDDTFASVTDSLQDANDLATQAANGTYSQKDLNNIKIQVDQVLQNLVDLANTKYNGNYLFSGTKTSEPAYSVTTDPATGTITAITYNGTPSDEAYQRYATIADGVSVAINAPGDEVFGAYDSTALPPVSEGMFGTLMSLSNALAAGDRTGITSSLDGMETGLDTVSVNRTTFASITNRFEMTGGSLNNALTSLEGYKSELEDADLATVLTDLSNQQMALQATMSVTSNMMAGVSLLDYV